MNNENIYHVLIWSRTGSLYLTERDGSDNCVLAESAAPHEVEQLLSVAREATRPVGHQALALCYSVSQNVATIYDMTLKLILFSFWHAYNIDHLLIYLDHNIFF